MAQALSAPDFLMKIFEKCRAAPIFTGNMDDSAYTISLAQFRRLFPVSSCLGMGDDVCLVNVRYDENLSVLRHPCRFDGFLAFFCVSGRMKVMINLTEFTVEENSMFVNIPGNVVSVSWVDETRHTVPDGSNSSPEFSRTVCGVRLTYFIRLSFCYAPVRGWLKTKTGDHKAPGTIVADYVRHCRRFICAQTVSRRSIWAL